jgi:excinuclease UvrABC nuclease subunit
MEARAIFRQLNGYKVPEVVSIAKQDRERMEKCDKIYIPNRKNPVTLRPDKVPEVVSIAKQDRERMEKCDKIYIPNRKNPVTLRPDHPVLLLMMRIRDEAHRRAITYHRKLMGKILTESELDHIPGVGAARKKYLIRHFKDIGAIAEASLDDLSEVSGISRSVARSIFSFFKAIKTEKSDGGGNVA